MPQASYHFFVLCLFISSILVSTGCSKDYSYEGGLSDTIRTRVPDSTVIIPASTTASCAACNATAPLQDGQWIFVSNGNTFCGKVEKSVITPERTAFTFFGPSACSIDSGFIATVYLDVALNRDQKNLSAPKVSFYYYDRQSPNYLLMSEAAIPFKLTITTYDAATGLTAGTFSGAAVAPGGQRTTITGGKFRFFMQ